MSKQQSDNKQTAQDSQFESYICLLCGYIYHEKDGCPAEGIPAGTRFEDLPEDWQCPDCGATKQDFQPYSYES